MISIHANSAFSDELTRLGVHSLEEIYGESFEPFSYERLSGASPVAQPDARRQNFAEVALDNFRDRVVELQSISDGSTVAAVDVSSRSIGWTGRGVVYALRGTIAWREEYAYRYLRCGPFLLHLKYTDFNVHEDARSKRVEDGTEHWGELRYSNPAGGIQSFLEMKLQSYVCRSAKDAVILFDGCLAATPTDGKALRDILDSAAGNRNVVIAVSKETGLNLFGERITSLLDGLLSPCLIDLDCLITEGNRSHRLLGRVFVGRLAHGGYGFRIDVDRRLTPSEAAEAVGRLMGGDLVVQGYPETLRLAHILSFFTPTEVIGLQHFLVKNYGLTPSKAQPLRRLLFGPFGRGEGA